MVAIENYIKDLNCKTKRNQEFEIHSNLIHNHPIIQKLRQVFKPKILNMIIQQIVLASKLEEEKDPIIESFGIDNYIVYTERFKSVEFKDQKFLYIVGIRNQEIYCTCEMKEAFEIPCCHIFAYLATKCMDIDFNQFSYWIKNKPYDLALKFKITKEDLLNIANINQKRKLNTKSKSIGGKCSIFNFENIPMKMENRKKINDITNQILKLKPCKLEETYNSFKKHIFILQQDLNGLNQTMTTRKQSKEQDSFQMPEWPKLDLEKECFKTMQQLRYQGYHHNESVTCFLKAFNSISEELKMLKKNKDKINESESGEQTKEKTLNNIQVNFSNLTEEQQRRIQLEMENIRNIEIWFQDINKKINESKCSRSEKNAIYKKYYEQYLRSRSMIFQKIYYIYNSSLK